MNEWWLGLITALWLGILTSISPCPLATNIAAVSFIARKVNRPRYVLVTGLLYTLGRTIAYVLLAIVLVKSALSVPIVSHWLGKYMHKLLGPILIVVAMMLLELISLGSQGSNIGQWCQRHAERFGLFGSLFLGFVFALSFCPISAALFFGSLIPLSIKHASGLLFPLAYGIATAVPVLGFGFVLACGAGALAKAFKEVTQFELWARRITGIIFILVGIYFTLAYTIGLKT